MPRKVLLRNPDSYARTPVRYRGVWWRDVCSSSFREEFFSETGLPLYRILANLTLSCVAVCVVCSLEATQDFHKPPCSIAASLPVFSAAEYSQGVRDQLGKA